jgi:hypothetical protein
LRPSRSAGEARPFDIGRAGEYRQILTSSYIHRREDRRHRSPESAVSRPGRRHRLGNNWGWEGTLDRETCRSSAAIEHAPCRYPPEPVDSTMLRQLTHHRPPLTFPCVSVPSWVFGSSLAHWPLLGSPHWGRAAGSDVCTRIVPCTGIRGCVCAIFCSSACAVTPSDAIERCCKSFKSQIPFTLPQQAPSALVL